MHRWNKNTIQSSQSQESSRPIAFEASAPSSTNSHDSASTSVDPFLLDFGTSINVTEDLRREIRSEIQEIVAKLAKGTQAHQQEQRLQKQLQQDLHHTFCEMRNLSRGAADRLEDAQVHSSFLNGLDTTLNTDVARPTGVLPECRKSPVSVLDTLNVTSLKDPPSPDVSEGQEKSGSSKTNQEVLKEKEEMLKQLVQSIQEQTTQGDKLRNQNQNWVMEKNRTLERIQSEGLVAVLEQTQQKNQHAHVDVQNESQRRDQLVAKVQSVRSQCGNHAQQLADKTKEIKALRADNEVKQVDMKSKVANAADSLSKQKEELGATKSSHGLVKSRMEELKQQEAYYNDFCQARKTHEETLRTEQEENGKLLQLLETLTAEQEKANQELEESKEALGNAQQLHDKVFKKKAENDRLEETVMKSGEEERSRLAQEKEQLATQIGKHHAALVQAQNEQKETLANKMETKNEVSLKVARLESELKEKQDEVKTRASARQITKGMLEQELQTMIDKEEQIRSEHKTKMETLQAAHQASQVAAKQALEAAKEKAKLQMAKERRFLETIQIGAKIIEKANEKEEKLNDDIVFI
ncbi:unnamed protein product [Cylindrotheca closterium]|uniref:Uncharacterized protein n=1 Tax=Cylindrotheca closterium TaxID=2856 RepID=A0AAD2CJG9_9STRA|nr:unnamed protein product [Cylindrotheca closterium]